MTYWTNLTSITTPFGTPLVLSYFLSKDVILLFRSWWFTSIYRPLSYPLRSLASALMLFEVAETDLWDNKLNRRRVVGIESFKSSLIFFFKRYSRIRQWTKILCDILPIILKKVVDLSFFVEKNLHCLFVLSNYRTKIYLKLWGPA